MERVCEGVITFEYICIYIDFFLNLGLFFLDFDLIFYLMMLIIYVNEGKIVFYYFFLNIFMFVVNVLYIVLIGIKRFFIVYL